MRKVLILTLFLVAVVTWSTNAMATDWIKERELAYDVSLSQYFDVSHRSISDLQDLGVAIEELPVVFLVADRAKTTPGKVGSARVGGASWMSIVESNGLKADIFYIMINAKYSSDTYSPILKKFDSVLQQQKTSLQLTDEEIVNLVNLKFISSVHDYSIFETMAMRDFGKDFPRINHQVMEAKAAMLAKEKEQAKEKKQKKKKAHTP